MHLAINDNAITVDGGKVILSVDLMAKSIETLDEIQTKMNQYREELTASSMREPTKRNSSSCHWYFYKPTTVSDYILC